MSRATRGTRGAKQDDPKPSKRQETLKATSQCALQARRRAQQCFLSMIEGPVEPKVFIVKARYINPEVYDDVVVERGVAGLCGYPMCPNTFTDTYGSRTYVIRNNKLYDITTRRNFCSNVCFEASELVRKQVLTLPLYLRDTQDSDIKDVRLPCLSRLNGRHGKLVDITGGVSKLDLDDDEPRNGRTAFMSVDDIARESLVNWSENEADQNKEQTEGGAVVTEISDAPPEDKNTDRNIGSDSSQNTPAQETTHLSHNKTETDNVSRKPVNNGEVIESTNAHQSVSTSGCGNSNQNTNTAEETCREHTQRTEDVDTNDKNPSEVIPVNSNTNQTKSSSNVEYKNTKEGGTENTEPYSTTREDTDEVRDSRVQDGRVSNKEGGGGSSPSKDAPESDASRKGSHKYESCKEPKTVDDPIAEVLKVEAMMRQWVSFESLRVVLGDLYVRGMLEHLGHSWEKFDTTSGLRLSVEAKAKYISICRRLEHEERLDEVEGEKEVQDKLDLNTGKQNRPTKALPDYSQLQRQAKKQQLKVVSFFGGNDQYEEPEEEKLESIPEDEEQESKSNAKRKLKTKKQSEISDIKDPTLPFVDSYSQVAWRQSIVVEKVTAYLQQLLEMTRLSVLEVKKLLGPLVATFHLSPNNISFRPKQWRLITLILLKMLSVRYPIIQDALRTEEGLTMQRTILSVFSLDVGYCDRVLRYLTEIQHILSKDFKDEVTMAAPQSAEVLQTSHPEGEHLQTILRDATKGTEANFHA